MGHLHMIRNHRPTMSMIKLILQYTFFLIVFVWLLYQIHHLLYVRRDLDCDFIENKLAEDHIARLLGRKGGIFGKPIYTEELELYGVDVIGEAVRINNVTEIDDTQIDNRETEDQGVQLDQLVQVESEEAVSEIEGKKVNSSMSKNWGNEDGESELESLVKVNGVILRKDEKLEILKFVDENGVSGHESGPSRRSDVEVKKGCISKGDNKTKEMEGSQNVCSQNVTKNHTVSKLEREGVEKEMPEMVTVKSAKGSMRDLLLSEM